MKLFKQGSSPRGLAPLASCDAQQGLPAQTTAGEVEKKESQIDRKTKVEEATNSITVSYKDSYIPMVYIKYKRKG